MVCLWFCTPKCACRIFLIIMSSGGSLSVTIIKSFHRLLRITGTSDKGCKFLELAPDQEIKSFRLLRPQGFGANRTEVPLLRRRVTAAAAALSEDQDEIQAVQHHRSDLSVASPDTFGGIGGGASFPLGSRTPIVTHIVQASFCACIHIHTLSCIYTIIGVMYAPLCAHARVFDASV